jgi:hypothetical protein
MTATYTLNANFVELTEEEITMLTGGGIWGAIATGLIVVGTGAVAIACPPVAAAGAAYYIGVGIGTLATGAISTYIAYKS